jgi:hypothetical protein
MIRMTIRTIAVALLICALAACRVSAAAAGLRVHVNKPGHRISSTLYGIFFEESNCTGAPGIPLTRVGPGSTSPSLCKRNTRPGTAPSTSSGAPAFSRILPHALAHVKGRLHLRDLEVCVFTRSAGSAGCLVSKTATRRVRRCWAAPAGKPLRAPPLWHESGRPGVWPCDDPDT